MKRNISRLSSESFDVLVVGAGIYGATIARAAALRGLKVALVELGDFGQATSANSLKVIHGGLRYLQHLNLKRMRESIIARRRLLRLAPHLVHPQACVIPTYGYGMRSRFLMAAAFFANDLIAWDRNARVSPRRRIPGCSILSRGECLKIMPGIDKDHLTGGAQWYDCIVSDTERLTLSFVNAAYEQGACVANYTRVDKYIVSGSAVLGAEVTDTLNGHVFDIDARLVISATGPWEGRLLQTLLGGGASGAICGWARAVNIVVERPIFENHAVGIASSEEFIDKDAVVDKGSRYLFFVPWRGGTLIGTNYAVYEGDPENCRQEPGTIAALVNEINRIYPAARLSPDEVSFSHVGLLPVKSRRMARDEDVDLAKNEQILDLEASEGFKGIISVTGVKYTTAVQVADRVADLALSKLGYKRPREVPDPPLAGGDKLLDGPAETLPGATVSDSDAQGSGSRHVRHLMQRYGTLYPQLLQIIREEPAYGSTLSNDHETIAAEVIYTVRHEMACKLSDVILRRTGLGSRAYPGKEAIEKCASIMAQELGWGKQRIVEEIAAVDMIYNVHSHA